MSTCSKISLACTVIALVPILLWSSESATIAQAQALVRSGQPQKAEQLLRQALVGSPDSAQLHGELGDIYYGLKRYEDAIEELGRAAQLDPSAPRYSMHLAEVLIALKRFPVAVDFLLAVKSRFDGSADYHYTLGIAYYGNNKFPSAKAEFERTVGLAPGLHSACFMLGSICANEGDLNQAVRFYRRAIKLAPRKADYYAGLGRVLIQIGPDHNKEAVDWLKRALSLDPECIPAKFYLALACEDSGDLRCAKKLLEEVTTTHPTELKAHIVLAGVYYRLKDREKGDREKAIISRLQAEEGPKLASDQPFHRELK